MRIPVARPLSDFTGLRRTTNPRQRRPFQQQFSLREMPIYDRSSNSGREENGDPGIRTPEETQPLV